jgi:hypothetical protein
MKCRLDLNSSRIPPPEAGPFLVDCGASLSGSPKRR